MDFLTLAGYVIAALAMALGLYLILRKNVADESTEVATDGVTLETDSAESETSGTQSSPSPSAHGIPVVPRHVREQLQASAVPASQPEQPIRQIVTPAPDADEDLLAQMPLITPERHSQVEDGDAEHSVHQAASISAAKHAAHNQNQNHNPNQNHNQNKADDFSENKPQSTDFADSPLLMQQAQQLAESSKPD
ncbi:MAG: hypothetical protein EOO68_14690 [Moraxellaceae bacterium]|nr:MAG: hypothetical protein EOO68_14690 [Moraxellaceae bacterium]